MHNNLRISVTDRCNLRCTYCMPEEVTFLAKEELLRFEEIVHFVRVAVPLGIDKIRLTGGEPLMRRELPRLVRMLCAIEGIRDVGLTTNGILLAEQAQAFYDAGPAPSQHQSGHARSGPFSAARPRATAWTR